MHRIIYDNFRTVHFYYAPGDHDIFVASSRRCRILTNDFTRRSIKMANFERILLLASFAKEKQLAMASDAFSHTHDEIALKKKQE